MPKGLEIREYTGEGYRRAVEYKTWTVAFLNWCPEYEKNTFIEAHTKTDEVFVLLTGKATLYIGREREPVEMEPCKCYNVTAGTFHNIVVSRDARVLVAENSDTCDANTEFIYL